VFSKIYQRIFYNRLVSFFDVNNVLSDKQFGFRKNHSTAMALLDIVNSVTNALDNKKYSLGMSIDLSKAFDTTNFDILLDKLNYYGIRGPGWLWLRSYVTNRKQFVSFNGTESFKLFITCGIPPGSILGPLLFLIGINDISPCSQSSFYLLMTLTFFIQILILICYLRLLMKNHAVFQPYLKQINEL